MYLIIKENITLRYVSVCGQMWLLCRFKQLHFNVIFYKFDFKGIFSYLIYGNWLEKKNTQLKSKEKEKKRKKNSVKNF